MRGGNFTGYVGSFTFEATPLMGGATEDFLTYCLTPQERIQTNQGLSEEYEYVSVFDQQQLIGQDAATAAAREQALADVSAAAAGMQLMPSENFAIAFQLMVWEIVLDYDAGVGASSLDLTGGTMRSFEADMSALDSEVAMIFDSLRAGIGSSGNTNAIAAFHHDSFQDQLVFVPTPAAGALLGMAGLVGTRRRR